MDWLKRFYLRLRDFFDFDPWDGTRPGYDWCDECGGDELPCPNENEADHGKA